MRPWLRVASDLKMALHVAPAGARANGLEWVPGAEARAFVLWLEEWAAANSDAPLAQALAQGPQPSTLDRARYDVSTTAELWHCGPSGVRFLISQEERIRRHAIKCGRAWMLDAAFVEEEAARRRALREGTEGGASADGPT